MPEVIVDTSPLQYLHQLGLLNLLPDLFRRIVVPGPVIGELAAGRRAGVDLPVPEVLSWVDVRQPESAAGVFLAWDLGAGEAAVLSLALEWLGAWVVMDDRLARQAARASGIPLLGTAGILLRAKRAGRLASVAPALDRLNTLGFRLKPATRQRILMLAGE